jgi:hypothetical protein
MSDCCHAPSDAKTPNKRNCPACGRPSAAVAWRTLLHHLAAPWRDLPAEQHYFFCDEPACVVVYFGADGTLIRKTQLRTPVGIKETAGDAPLCYCFGISKADFEHDPALRAFVVAQTRAGQCACDVRNPSGRCCLKDFG